MALDDSVGGAHAAHLMLVAQPARPATGPDRQAGDRAGQRSANRHPVMSAPTCGGCPAMTSSSRRRKSPTEATRSSAWV